MLPHLKFKGKTVESEITYLIDSSNPDPSCADFVFPGDRILWPEPTLSLLAWITHSEKGQQDA